MSTPELSLVPTEETPIPEAAPETNTGAQEQQPLPISAEDQAKLRQVFQAVQAKEKELQQVDLVRAKVAAEVEAFRANFKLMIREAAEEYGVSTKQFDLDEDKEGKIFFRRKGG